MALQKSMTLDNGVVMNSAFMKISKIIFSLSDINRVDITLDIYYDSTSYSNGKPEVTSIIHSCSGEDFDTYFGTTVLNQVNKNYLDQGYLWLLTLDLYSDAIQV